MVCEPLNILIIDDLMQFRSMRREIYVMTRDNQSALLVVWVRTSVDVALARNNSRTGRDRISIETIHRIHNQLQPPDSSFVFDRAHLVVDGDNVNLE